jgi:3',5'-cyclic AMP phosphodiesterase CpdA
MKDIFYDCDIPVIITRGNHDDNSSGDRSEDKIISNTWWNNNMCYSFNKASSKFTFTQNSNGYYYYNIIDKKIRVVNINSEDLTDDERITIGGQNYAVISQNQLDWLNEDALIVEDDWKIIIVSHISCDTGRPNMSISNSDLLMEVIKNNKDNIILYIYGHTHISVNYMNKDLGIQFISTNTSGGSHVTYTEPGHNWGYVSSSLISSCDTGAMLFDICILNYDNTISRYRWGVKDDVLESDNMNSYLN